jgi:alkylmercury lyase
MTKTPSTRELAEAISDAMPPLGATEQRLAVALYRALAEGQPVENPQVARRAGLGEEQVRDLLSAMPGVSRDDDGRIVGFLGLSLLETAHRFEVEGIQAYTWCAWDPLFIGPLLGKSGHVMSLDPKNGAAVSLTVTPEAVQEVTPSGAVVSFLMPDKPWEQDIVQCFCHYVLFFSGRESGERWTADHPGTFLLSVEDAYEVGRHTNAMHFGDLRRT